MNDFLTVKNSASAEIIEKRSRFLSFCDSVRNREEAEKFIASKKSEFKDATHNTWAYLINDGDMRASDDGEPSGTAGVPILDVIKKEQLVQTVIVVTRYFGGVLLGAGGLVRAYSAAAKAAVDAAGIACMRHCILFSITCAYSDGGKIENIINQSEAVLLLKDYGGEIILEFYIREASSDDICSKIIEATGARAVVKRTGEGFYPL